MNVFKKKKSKEDVDIVIYIRHNWKVVFHHSVKRSKLNYSLVKKYASILLETVVFLSGVSMQYFSPDQYDSYWRISFY